jgi:antitoxin component YwqK of YwqJK toxin-antitoxin module
MNGRLYSMGNFMEGMKEGMWEYFDDEGKLNKIQVFENDILIKCEGKCPEKDDE